jgi:hypothetical protein
MAERLRQIIAEATVLLPRFSSHLRPEGRGWVKSSDPAARSTWSKIRGYAVQGLPIANASIMPQVPGGNTNAPSIMIGGKYVAMTLEGAQAAWPRADDGRVDKPTAESLPLRSSRANPLAVGRRRR